MKKFLALLLALAMVFALAACGGGEAKPAGEAEAPEEEVSAELAGTYDVTIWVADAAVDLTKQQIEDFNKTNEFGIVINAKVEPVSEADAATLMITDVQAGGDLFCFAQDQFARLVQAGALSKLGPSAADFVKANNDAGVVAAATAGEEIYAYPLTSDNGYFMYYDKSVIPEEDLDSMEKLIEDCEKANKYFAFEMDTSAWYMASFFFATGCVSEWTTDADGKFVSVKDTFNSPEGLIAVKGMQKLVQSPMFLSSSDAAAFDQGAAIVVCGTWGYETVSNILGDHLGSFNGCKLMGVKPQSDPTRAAVLHKLAQYLTGEQCQMERFNALSWGPSNLVDQASPEVQANPGLAALLAQAPYSVPQGQIHGSWWDIAKVIAAEVKAAPAGDEAALQAALDNYYNKINSLFEMSEEEQNAWGVIGAICGTNWDTDFPMTEVEPGVFESEVLELHAGEEFKVRQGGSWDVNFGVDGENFKVEEDGNYIVRFTFDGENGTIELIAQ